MFSPARGKSRNRIVAPSTAAVSPLSAPQTSPAPRGIFPPSVVIAARPPVVRSADRIGIDGSKPVFVCDLPQQLRASHADHLPVQRTDSPEVNGGMDGKSGLSWILHGDHLYIWSHLTSRIPQDCAVLTIPPQFCVPDERANDPKLGDNWLICIVGRQTENHNDVSFVKGCFSAGVVMCNVKSMTVIYWPDAFAGDSPSSVVSLGSEEKVEGSVGLAADELKSSSRKANSSWNQAIGGPGSIILNSLIASPVPGASYGSCVAIAGRSNGDLWRFDCCPEGISRERVVHGQIVQDVASRAAMGIISLNSRSTRQVVWRSHACHLKKGCRQLLLLTAAELECWDVELASGGSVTMAWHFNILDDSQTKGDLVGQKQVWLLDLQADESGNFFTVLVVSFSKDRINSSNHMQYSLLTFFDNSPPNGNILRKASIQVILPKARVENEDILYSMRLRTGGKPAGSAIILASDGTATVTHYHNGNLRLYQFELAWGVGKVLDAAVVPPLEDGEDGAWLVLTEKAGIWAIPEKAILLGGVEPPERSLSRRGSLNEESAKDERRKAFADNFALRRVSSETGVAGEHRERVPARVMNQRPLHDEEAEAIVGRLFQQFIASGEVEMALEKLSRAGAFEREGEMNIFSRTSRVLIDTLAKHWVSGGAAGAAIMAAVSSQLMEKQRRHQQYLSFLAASKCHEELQQKQRGALHCIMEHGEKLAAMVQLRDLHNIRAQARSQTGTSSAEQENPEVGGALWDTVHLVGEKARRNNVMLMDREKSEVFYTRVSDFEEFFACIQQHANSIIGREQPLKFQIDRLCEIAKACTASLRAAIIYRDSQQSWYPSPEGLTPWYCRPTVRSGVWKVATLILEVKSEASVSVPSMEPALVSWLEEVTDILLEGYAGAITAKVEREEEYRGLQMEYWSRRNTLLDALQKHAKAVADSAAQQIDGSDRGEQKRLMVLREVYPSLVALARRHAGYETLLNICMDLGDMTLLHRLMHESMGLREGRFSHYVFEQMYRQKQYAKVLKLGEEFAEELASFLQEHRHLRWLHEVFMEQFTSASGTLQSLAVCHNYVDKCEATCFPRRTDGKVKGKEKLAGRRRLLYLAKIALLAGGEPGAKEKVARIDAQTVLIAVQEEAARKGVVGGEIVSPIELVDACLKSDDRDLLVLVFDVFAFAGETFRKGNKSRLEGAWLQAVDQDDWPKMRQISEEDGWSDEQHWQALQRTALFQVSKRCYAADALVYGAPFHATLPLFENDHGLLDGKGRAFKSESGKTSVEAVLLQHPDFPDAGQAMITALKMGSSQGFFFEKEIDSMVET